MSKQPRDISASVRARLMSISKINGEAFDLVLVRFAIERLLYRLSKSKHRDRFVVKGAIPPTRSDSQTPDEMYFRKGNDIPNQLSDARTVARQARLAANRAVVCSKCALTDCVVQIDNKPNETG